MRSFVGLWRFPRQVQQLDRIESSEVIQQINGVVKVDRGFVVARGVVWDQNERWILSFNRYLGFCSVTEAELWGIKNGLEPLLEQNYDSILIQTDSTKEINAIQDQVPNVSGS
ncbi:hypothetical protein Gorai_014539 [Gossypium raimondii]|uniref:RNase H type-1 domain-containing protein n=1 Tax=Gossypium raimondii TaxID=29730 RepID=A0A7J8P436_GOSRA|nr:hypothetical protein [Gossypium raimondii]